MKKFRFAFLALVVSAIAFAFTPFPSYKTSPTTIVYGFGPSGMLLDSASSRELLKEQICPGANETFCAQVWTSKTEDNEPAGTRLEDLEKPLNP